MQSEVHGDAGAAMLYKLCPFHNVAIMLEPGREAEDAILNVSGMTRQGLIGNETGHLAFWNK